MLNYQYSQVHLLIPEELHWEAKGHTWLESKPIATRYSWNEAIPSWNVDSHLHGTFQIELRAKTDSGLWTQWFQLGTWAAGPNNQERTSVNSQKDSLAEVNTDTFHLFETSHKIQLRIQCPDLKSVKRITICTSNTEMPPQEEASNPSSWNTFLPVPKRCQNDYPNGGVICSATSSAMILKYWAKMANRSDLDCHVVDAANGIFDQAWHGTGNWPFNMAFVGSFPKMVAYVARFASVSDLEAWIHAGIPVATSVSYNLLRGKPRGANDGHLVVLVGFNSTGNPIFNDPAIKAEEQTTYPREDFLKAWSDSGRTVYLAYPEGVQPPTPRNGQWLPYLP